MFEVVAPCILQQNLWPFLNEPLELLAEVRLVHAQFFIASADSRLVETVFSVVGVNVPPKMQDAVGMAALGKPRHGCGKFTQLPTPCPVSRHPLQED
jgi:hypothetical protein